MLYVFFENGANRPSFLDLVAKKVQVTDEDCEFINIDIFILKTERRISKISIFLCSL